MEKLSVLFLVICVVSLLDQGAGFNYYMQPNQGNPGLLTYPIISSFPGIWKPDWDKRKDKEEKSSGESSESSSSENSSEEGKEEGEGKEKKEKKENKEGEENGEKKENKEGEENGEKKENKSEEEGSSSGEEDESKSREDSSEEKGEKKKEGEKKEESNSLFPPRMYNFAPSKIQKIVYTPLSTNAYSPYRSIYAVQPAVASYPMVKNAYQFISGANAFNDYSSPIARKLVSSPITRIVFAPSGLSYPAVSKTVLSPGASVQDYWNRPFNYFRK